MDIKNKKAYFDYYVKETYEAGIELLGTEIKSIRNGSLNLKDSYIRIKDNEAYVINMYIAKYDPASSFNHDEYRNRKLLLHKKEIIKLKHLLEESNLTLVPLRIYFKKDHVKLEIGLCQGKHNYDKRDSIKRRDIERSNGLY